MIADHKCATCKWWMCGKGHRANWCRQMSDGEQASDTAWAIAECENCHSTWPTSVETGPDFGCVHWEKKE